MMEMKHKLQFDEFLRSVVISKNDSYSFLMGAGCSTSSGIPSANDCIWDWKTSIYKSNHSSSTNWVENYKNPRVQEMIQKWLDNQGEYISKGSTEEYSFYAKKCFPIEKNRNQYFQSICSNVKPAIGYRLIPILSKLGVLDSIWTTNFDDLVMHSCVLGNVQSIDISLDTVNRINQRAQNKLELPVIKLHGDFKYGELKNTNNELKHQDETFRKKLIEYTNDKHLIVCGYSGRDKSLMDSLKEAYSNNGGGILFWCGYGDYISDEVKDLLDHAHKNNRTAFYIPTDGFDKTMIGLTRLLVQENNELSNEFSELLKSEVDHDYTVPFNLNPNRVNKILKSNIFPIKFPEEVFVFDAEMGEKPWIFVNDRVLNRKDISAIPYQKSIWAFGTLEVIKETFKDVIQGSIVRKPLANVKVYHSAISSLLLSTLCKTLTTSNELQTDFRNKIWKKESENVAGYEINSAIRLALEKISGKYYLALNPSFHPINSELSKDALQQIGITFYHKIWNKQFNEYVDKWRKTLLVQTKFEFPTDSGSGFSFFIDKSPLFTEINDLNNLYTNSHNVPRRLINLKGVQFKESPLVFSTKNGDRHEVDTHPMRGLINNKPYETGINTFLDNTINLAVIAPENGSEELFSFLNKQNTEIKKYSEKEDYIIDFQGFFSTYGVSLNIPDINSPNWSIIEEPKKNDFKESVHEIKRNICDEITKLSSLSRQRVLVIYIPSRWDSLTSYTDTTESFDLHDYVKAFCVEKRITSQFIREKTIIDERQSCQINWWLSLSYFVKSFRTPWVLDNVDKSTAFAGIGYSIDSQNNNKGHIILGCSHIYSSTGEGLKYKLSKISNDKIQWRHKKPHLNYDDAYEFGRSVLNLFYESMNTIPKRVVIHKRTFFTDDEKQGILDSLHDNPDIETVDLIEINFEDDIRYVSSKIYQGKTQIDGFSVSRGTCIQLDSKEALLWAHGVIPSVKNPKYNFYPGGRYIPKPLKITKHHGTGSLEQIANEILGLTKMNWNSLNMYSQLPATISSSNDIARIGKLIENKDKIEYDYRYFI